MGEKRKNEENFRGKHSRRWFAEEWKQRKLYSRTEKIKRNATATYQIRQLVEEAIENSNSNVEYLTAEFKDEIEAINGKKAETEHLMAEIAKTKKNLLTAKIGKRLTEWDRKLQILRE